MKMKNQKAENDKIKSPAAMDGYIQYQIERDPHHRDNTKLNSTLVEKLNTMCSDLTRLTYIKQARLADKDRSIEIKQQIFDHMDDFLQDIYKQIKPQKTLHDTQIIQKKFQYVTLLCFAKIHTRYQEFKESKSILKELKFICNKS